MAIIIRDANGNVLPQNKEDLNDFNIRIDRFRLPSTLDESHTHLKKQIEDFAHTHPISDLEGQFFGVDTNGDLWTRYLKVIGSPDTNHSPVLGSVGSAGLYLTNTNTNYGLMFGVTSNGNTWIQSQRSDGNTAVYTIDLNPAGGGVRINGNPVWHAGNFNGSTLNNSGWNRSQTLHGFIDFGPANQHHGHIHTDRGSFHFNKPILVGENWVSLDNHTHNIPAITGLQTALDNRLMIDNGVVFNPLLISSTTTTEIALLKGGGLGAHGASATTYPVSAYELFGWNFTVQQVSGQGAFKVMLANRTTELFRVSENGVVSAGTYHARSDITLLNGSPLVRFASNGAHQRGDARADATNFARIHKYGVSSAWATSNFREAWFDGSQYVNIDVVSNSVRINNNTIWHAGNFNPGSYSLTSHLHSHLTAGNGLTSTGIYDGGTARTFSIGQGTGITVFASSIRVEYIVSGSSSVGAVCYNGVTATSGVFNGGTSMSNFSGETTRINYNGQLTATGMRWGVNGGSALSDELVKYDVENIDDDFILKLRPVSFRYHSDGRDLQYGLVAQEVEEILGDNIAIVKKPNDENYFYGLDYTQLIAPMIATIQRLEKRIAELEKKEVII